MDRRDVLRASIARDQAELAALEAMPNLADLPDGTVLRYEFRPGNGAHYYTYVVLKAGATSIRSPCGKH